MDRHVLITGASTGIGRTTSLHLDGLGWTVHAGVRKVADGEALKAAASDRLTPVIVDVTDQATITAAAASVDDAVGSDGLAGLVNNAGVAFGGPLEFLPVEDLRGQLEVNVIGQVAVTQAFMPLVRRAKGRVVFTSSIAGRVALPMLGPYAASKHAIEAIADSLRRELRSWGIEVSLVEPGSITTEIWEKASDLMEAIPERIGEAGMDRYAEKIALMQVATEKTVAEAIPAIEVAKVIEHALSAAKPRTRYLVGSDAKQMARASALLPDRLFDRLVARETGI